MKLRYERGALADLDEIFAYIAKDNREAAARLVARFEQVAVRIAENPFMGEATRKSRFRRFPVGNYLIDTKSERAKWPSTTSATVRVGVPGKANNKPVQQISGAA